MNKTSMRAIWIGGAALAGAVWLGGGQRASAVVTATWVVDSYEEFDEGEAKGSFISSVGEVKPGWAVDQTELEFDGAWSLAGGSDGTAFIGSDDDGAIYQVKKGVVSKLTTIPDIVAVVSLAMASDGTLYAGTMPGGQIWRINTSTGKAVVHARLKDVESVWALAIDASGKTLYAGTGPNGVLYAVDIKSGKSQIAFKSGDKRIMSLAAASDGSIWMGTSDKALVFRHVPERKMTRAMADFAGNEVSGLAEVAGSVVVAANDLEPASSGPEKTKAAIDKAKKKDKPGAEANEPKAGTAPGADKKEVAGTEPPRKKARKGKGALFRVRGDGQLTQLHALTATYFTSVVATNDGRIFAGAADKGRIYLVEPDDSVSTAFDVGEREIGQIVWSAKHGLSFTTGDATAFYHQKGSAPDAMYTSDVFDASAPARFGKLVWRASGEVALETRSGNTAKPGIGWSGWQAPKSQGKTGGGGQRGEVTSPPGRYFQYRVHLRSGAELRQTSLYYLPHNRATVVKSVTIGEDSDDDDEAGKLVTMASGAAKPRSPVLKIKWEVDNEDKDETTYRLEVRRDGEVRWRRVATGDKPLTETKYEWNTETFPDGYYRLRVIASDGRSNSADRAMESHKTTNLFLVDNQKPAISGVTVKYPAAAAQAVDAMSEIAEMAFSVDDGPWQVGATRDGLFDEPAEFLKIDLPRDLDAGVHTLAIRAADSAGNIGSVSVTFVVNR